MTEHYGNIVDVYNKRIFYGVVHVSDGKIKDIKKLTDTEKSGEPFILPGFVDAHVHVESSLLIPSEFARLAVLHGTVATISDPHEIANVCGMEGVKFMIENGKSVPFKFHYGAPSCVPATIFETAGAELNAAEVDELLQLPDIYYLSEMMNFPGVLANDPMVMQKIASAKKNNKPIDGHAPGLRGNDAKKYIEAGISTDHECFTEEEAAEKLSHGMKILIREGSAAKNFEALIPLMQDNADNMMFCSDDKHPDSLLEGHINQLCARAIAKGIDRWKVLKAACINPVQHYKMNVGTLKAGDYADFIKAENLTTFNITETIINGITVAKNGKSLIDSVHTTPINHFNCNHIAGEQLRVPADNVSEIQVIGALNGQLITEKITVKPLIQHNQIVTDTENDIIKIAVINRYNPAPVAIAFIKNTGINNGAFASSVAHDSHNIVVAGTNDEDMAKAVNLIIDARGGLSAVQGDFNQLLSLPVAGLMSNEDAYTIAETYTEIDKFVKQVLGSTLSAPFMTLSFMALLVIPHLKLSDKGLFDGDTFSFL